MAKKYLSEREYVDLVGDEHANREDYNRLNGPIGMCREVIDVQESFSLVCNLPEGHGGDCSAESQDDSMGGRGRLSGGRRR